MRATSTSPEKLATECQRREAVLWIVIDKEIKGLCFTRSVLLSDERKAIEVTALAGNDALPWLPLLRERLHEYRKAEMADLLLVVGRRGWGRLFKKAPVGMNTNGLYIFEDDDG